MLTATVYLLFPFMLLLFVYCIFKASAFHASHELTKKQRAHLVKMVTHVQLGGQPNAGIDWGDQILKSFWDVPFASHHREITMGRNPMLLYHPKIQELIQLYSEESDYAVLRPTPKMVSISEKKRKPQKEVLF